VEDQTSGAERIAYYNGLNTYARDPVNYPPRFDEGIAQIALVLKNLGHQLTWSEVEMFADEPGKNARPDEMTGYGVSGKILSETAAATTKEILAETPYFVPMQGTMILFHQLKNQGVKVSILTNSVSSTDNYPAFAGYDTKREAILNAGIDLFELGPDPDSMTSLIERLDLLDSEVIIGSHAKTAVFDRKRVFIGSFNLDPRSTHLNTELGILVESEAFASQVAESILLDMDQSNSWYVSRGDSGSLIWRTKRDGENLQEKNPDVGFMTSVKILFLSILPIENIL